MRGSSARPRDRSPIGDWGVADLVLVCGDEALDGAGEEAVATFAGVAAGLRT